MTSPNQDDYEEVFEVVDNSMDNGQTTFNQVEHRSRYSSIPCSTNNTRGRAVNRFRESLRGNIDGRSTTKGANKSQANNRNMRGERGDPSYFRNDRWRNEEKRCMMIPSRYCAICCRVLYEYEVCLMKFEVERELDMFILSENLIWPVLSYRDPDGEMYVLKRKKGKIAVCSSHKGHGKTAVSGFKEYIKFANTKWSYPGDIPEELSGLDIRFEEFLSPIRVFCELTNRFSLESRATRAGYHFVNGRIGLYQSPLYIGDYSGTRGIAKSRGLFNTLINEHQQQKLLIASEWIRANNPLFSGQNPGLSVYADELIPESISS
ncbi:hypothetical protein FBU30_000920 [Linnemannia zychae]|nr:hypothetical protein FBU30_000920 [Linnemannia zychae]